MARAVGIDLGTTNSAIAVIEGGRPIVLANAEGARTTPSVVAFLDGDERLVGSAARRQAILNPKTTIHSAKRFIGRSFNEAGRELERVSYPVVPGTGGGVRIRLPDRMVTPEEIAGLIIRKLADDARRALDDDIRAAVITVPAYFNDAQRQATRDAGRIAGLEVLRVVNEPTAAALAYGLDRTARETVLVFDLGGGTFDVSILDVGNGRCEVRSTSGDPHLGGDDFDRRIVAWLAEECLRRTGVDPRSEPQSHQRLVEAAEQAKVELSGMRETTIHLPFLASTPAGPLHLDATLSRSRFEELSRDLVERCRGPLAAVLEDAGLRAEAVDRIILVGGATRIPAVQRMVREVMGEGRIHMGLNPDEAVALGAAVQAGILTDAIDDIVLVDVLPLSVGVETVGGVMTPVIPRNTPIPVRRTEVFTTAEDGQEAVDVVVLQGERLRADDNRVLGRFRFDGIRRAPRGVPQIEVSFAIDADGILHVYARDRDTGRHHRVTITETTNLPRSAVENMLEDAERHVAEDRRRRARTALRDEVISCAYHLERTLRELGATIPSPDRRRGERLIVEVRSALQRNVPATRVRTLMSDVEETLRLLAALYGADRDRVGGRERRTD